MKLEIQDIQKRALTRFVTEEIKKQENIERITEKLFLELNENAKPENIGNALKNINQFIKELYEEDIIRTIDK